MNKQSPHSKLKIIYNYIHVLLKDEERKKIDPVKSFNHFQEQNYYLMGSFTKSITKFCPQLKAPKGKT